MLPHPRWRLADQRGFTLTELLVALTVTVIGLAGLLSLHVTTVRGNASAGRAAEAVVAAEQTLEAMRATTVPELESATWFGTAITTATEEVNFTLPIVSGRNGLEYKPVVFARQIANNLVRLRTVVYWMDDGAVMPANAQLDADADHSLELQLVRTRVEVQ